MRTYSRKKPECQLLENVHELCRLCLTKSDYVVPIFDNKNDNNYTTLPIRIMICIGIEVTPEENLPNIICKDCYQQIQNISSFRKKCEMSYLQLKSHLIAVKQNLLLTLKTEHEGQVLDQVEKKTDETISIAFENEVSPGVLVETKESLADECDEKIKEVSVQNVILGQTVEIKEENIQIYYEETSDIKDDIKQTSDITEQTPLEHHMKTEYVTDETTTHDDTAATEEFDANSCPAPLGLRPQACALSPRRSTQRETMLGHRLVHQEVRPFTCSVCPKSFTQSAALRAHARSHRTLHRCPRCPKTFLYASGLSRHMMWHDGRTFMCKVCNRLSTDWSSMLRHVKRAGHGHGQSIITCQLLIQGRNYQD